MSFSFKVKKKMEKSMGRLGVIKTPHGQIQTPSFVVVGTKATVKSLTPEHVKELGAQVVLANTYHLYLEPGEALIKKAGGLGKFMNWKGPTMTDSGGFQAFSLGAAFDKGVGKIAKEENSLSDGRKSVHQSLAKITEDGVEFKSYKDGTKHFFTPEKSIEIQHDIGADMIFAFDECTSPFATHDYQKSAMERTHRWAARCIAKHLELKAKNAKLKTRGKPEQALFGIVQGGRFEDLRKESAKTIGSMDFDGFGIGGSFGKEDIQTAIKWVNNILPENKPRHLLGIGDPIDLLLAIEAGCDLFDCVAPSRQARNGSLYTKRGKINVTNSKFMKIFSPIEKDCMCYTCKNYTTAYLAHLFRSNEILANTLGTIHNLHFVVTLVDDARNAIIDNKFNLFKKKFINRYQGK